MAAAIKAAPIKTLLGEVKVEDNGQTIQNIYLVQVKNGKIISAGK
jgi:hypothetical protein